MSLGPSPFIIIIYDLIDLSILRSSIVPLQIVRFFHIERWILYTTAVPFRVVIVKPKTTVLHGRSFHARGGFLQRDPLRVFYSTLREQLPESEMAEVWWVIILCNFSSLRFSMYFS